MNTFSTEYGALIECKYLINIDDKFYIKNYEKEIDLEDFSLTADNEEEAEEIIREYFIQYAGEFINEDSDYEPLIIKLNIYIEKIIDDYTYELRRDYYSSIL